MASYPDLLLEHFNSLIGWTDGDRGTGVSEIDPAGQLRMDTNAGAENDDYCWQYRTIDSPPNKFTIEIRTYFDAPGARYDNDFFSLRYATSTWIFRADLATNGLFICKTGGGATEVGTDIVETEQWQTWRFEVDKSGGEGSATVEVFLREDGGDFVSQGTFDCDYEGSFTDGRVGLVQYGYTTDDRIAHVDYCLIATGNDEITTATDWKSPGTVSGVERAGQGAISWSNENNAKVSDDNYASALNPYSPAYSPWLRCINFGLTTADLPLGSIIAVIEVSIERKGGSAEGQKDSSIKLRNESGQQGSDKADTSVWWQTSDDTVIYIWNAEEIGDIDDDDLRDSDMGVDISAWLNANYAYVDHVAERVWYIPSEYIELTGAIGGQSALQGALSAARKLAGAIAAQSGVTGSLEASKKITGAIASQSSVQAALSLAQKLTGTAAGQSLVQAILTLGAEEALAGTIGGQSTVEGALSVDRKLTGEIAAQSTVQGSIDQIIKLVGTIVAQSGAGGDIINQVFIAGVIAAASTVEGQLMVKRLLAGEVAGQSEMIGALTVPGPGGRQSGMFLVI